MPRTQAQLNEYKRAKRKELRDHISSLESIDSNHPEVVAFYSDRSARNAKDAARRKTWPSQASELRSDAGKKKRAKINSLAAIDPHNPEVVEYRTYQNEKAAKWRSLNPEKTKIAYTDSRKRHREVNNQKSRERHALNPFIARAKQETWRVNNLDKVAAYKKKWLATHPEAKVANILRNRLNKVLRGKLKVASAIDLLGCSLEYFMQFIAKQFKPGMSWENYGLHTWHIDHLKPCTSFDMNDPWQQRWCFHYSNLQPMFAKENISKSNKLPQAICESFGAQPQFA